MSHAPPKVSVIIAVYNTGEYLPETLSSLTRQTLDPHDVEIVLIDDGSTDDSPQIIDDFAAEHPDRTVVVHQPNSGTPASPFNRGLDRATGRYVFFLGSDDWLADDALERLVSAADEWGSDVIFGQVVPVGGHIAASKVYEHGTTADLDLFHSKLPRAISNSKLFRRDLIEQLGLRYREDMRQRCDQPFTLTAIIKGGRTSLLVDGDLYYARMRDDRSNVTYTADWRESLHSTRIVMDTIVELVEPGRDRDHVMRRQFDVGLRRLIADDLPRVDPTERPLVLEAVRDLVDRHLTEWITVRLSVINRLRILFAHAGDLAGLEALASAMDRFAEGGTISWVVDGDRWYLAYEGFGSSLPRSAFEVTYERPVGRVERAVGPAEVTAEGGRLRVTTVVAATGLTERHVSAQWSTDAGHRGDLPVRVTGSDSTCSIVVDIKANVLPPRHDVTVWLQFTLGRSTYDVAVRTAAASQVHRLGRLAVKTEVESGPDAEGRLILRRR